MENETSNLQIILRRFKSKLGLKRNKKVTLRCNYFE